MEKIKEYPNRIQIGRLIINDKDIFKRIMSSNDNFNKKQLTISIPNVLKKYDYYGDLYINDMKLIINNNKEEIVIYINNVVGGNISGSITSFLDNKNNVDKTIKEIIDGWGDHIFYSEIWNFLNGYNNVPKDWIGKGISYSYMVNKLRLNGISVTS